MPLEPTAATVAETALLASTRARLADLESRLDSIEDPPRKVRALLDAGRHDEAWRRLPELLAGGLEGPGPIQAAAVLEAVHDYEQWVPLARTLIAERGDEEAVRRIAYRWWYAVDDLERIERYLDRRARSGESDRIDRLARARLHALMLEREDARAAYEAALDEAETEEERGWALHGLGGALYRFLDFDGALARMTQALELVPLDPDLLSSLSDTLIRLGRTDEGIELLEMAIRLAPYHQRAHYMLGNGYARKSYSQLYGAYPAAFVDDEHRGELEAADGHFAAGRLEVAGAAYEQLRREHPGWADVAARLGSLAFTERRFDHCRRYFVEALELCPEYGRAHNGLAKALEAARHQFNVHRELYESRFEARPMPEIAGIEEYIVNWSALEPRHQKQVALGVEPWARYLPVLREAGSTHYIKPIHELLSETPRQDLLRDERITYDSRLWDDVRGVGGYSTVTGIEDVERAISNGYNTVLHELTHQVHQVLEAEGRRRIQELYRRTKEKDDATGEAFLSRYAGGSVWEYFAEGANALASPRRDRFDTREIVRERLEAKDPALLRLVRELQVEADLDGAFTVAWVNRGSEHLRRGRAEEAIASFRRAIERTGDDEDALSSLIHALNVAGRVEEALELAEREARRHPESAELAADHAQARWLAGHGLTAALDTLRRARDGVRDEERYLIDQRVGSWSWTAGDADSARRSYEAVLAYQADHPYGLWGLAASHALAGDWDEAWLRYEQAVRLRTGIVGLRGSYAHDLLRAGESSRARVELDAALLLDPEDPEILALEALWFLSTGRIDEAAATAERALGIASWSDMARLARAKAWIANGEIDEGRGVLEPLVRRIEDEAPPDYVYRAEKGSWTLVHTLPAVLRWEVSDVA